MGLIPDTAFTVRKPAWWDESGQFDLDDYPGREDAMRLAGHAWDVIEVPSYSGFSLEQCEQMGLEPNKVNGLLRKDEGWKSHARSDNGVLLHKSKETFERIQNSVAYDLAEILLGEGFKYQCGISMDEGRQNALTLLLDEPIEITGDTSVILPLVAESWCHDGTGSLKIRSTTIRNECQNTVSASEAEAARLGTDFTFRHTKNVHERIEDAREAIKGIRKGVDVYRAAMEELAAISVTPEQRDLYVSTIIGDRGGVVSTSATVSTKVKNNIERERAKINGLFFGPTIPEEHLLTGYGLHLAGVEYFDHLRAYRSKDSYIKRTLLSDNPAKANLTRTIREITETAVPA